MSVTKVSKNAAIYGIGTLLRNITALIMLPIYTRYLNPADYGAVEMLAMALDLASILIGLRITQAMFRFYILEDNDLEKKYIISTVLISIVVLSSIGAFLLQLLAPKLVMVIFGDIDYLVEFKLFVLTLITMAISNTGMAFIQAQQLPVLYVTTSLFTLLLQVSGNIYFVVYKELHVIGVVYSSLLSGVLTSLILGIYVLSKVGVRFRSDIFFRLARFVYPLIAASMAGFYVAYSDKYFLRVFDGLASVGLYVLAGRLASILATFYATFNQSWSAARFEIYKQEDNNEIFNQVFKLMSLASIIISSGLIMFSKDVIYFMTNESYHAALSIIPFFVMAVFVRNYVMFFNFGILLKEKTKYLALASWVKALASTILYPLFIVNYGVLGAVVALFTVNIIEVVFVYNSSKKLYDMGLRFSPVVVALVSCLPFLISGWLIPAGGLFDTSMRVLLYLGIVVLMFFLPIWNHQEKDYMRSVGHNICAIFRYK